MVNNFSTKAELSQDNTSPLHNGLKMKENVCDLENLSPIKVGGPKFSLHQRINWALENDNNRSLESIDLPSAIKNMEKEFTQEPAKLIFGGNQDDENKEQIELGEEDYAHPNPYFQNQRIKILESFCQSKRKRCISNDSWLLSTFNDVDLIYNTQAKSFLKISNHVYKSRSCEVFPGLFYKQSIKTEDVFPNKKEENCLELNDAFLAKPLWINGRNADTFRFLIQWLVVSLVDVPLMILQLHASNNEGNNKLDEANKNAIAKICMEADKKGWTTGDLMAIISRESFQNTNESVEDCARRALYFHT